MTSASSQNSSVSYRRLAQLALGAAVVAAAINALLFFIFRPLGAWPQDVIIPNAGQPMSLPPILIFSFVSVLVAGLVFALLARFTGRPVRIFYIVAAVVFVGFFFTPFTIPGAPAIMIIALELAHIPPALASLWALPRAVEARAA